MSGADFNGLMSPDNFYFHGGRQDFFKIVEAELGISITSQPVQIALP